jgi:hypothetical protein
MEDIYQVLELHLLQTILCLSIHGEPGSNNFKDKYLVGGNVMRILNIIFLTKVVTTAFKQERARFMIS